MKPMIKQIYSPTFTEDKVVFGYLSEAIEIETDNDENLIDLIKMLTKGYSIEYIYNNLNIEKEEIDELIDDLDQFGLLVDIEDKDSNVDKERYKTNLNFFSSFSNLSKSPVDFQQKINDATVVLLGVGGATQIALNLIGIGIKKLILVDYDTIELSNLSRQLIFTQNDIGKSKVSVAKKRLQEINPNIEIETYDLFIDSSQSLEKIIPLADIVINSIDTPPIQSSRWVNYSCIKHGVPLIQGGVTGNSVVVDIFDSTSGGCYDCYLLNAMKEDSDFISQIRKVYSRDIMITNPSFSPNISILAGVICNEAAKILTKYHQPLSSQSCLELSILDYNIKHLNNHIKAEDCPSCGSKQNQTEPLDIESLIKVAENGK